MPTMETTSRSPSSQTPLKEILSVEDVTDAPYDAGLSSILEVVQSPSDKAGMRAAREVMDSGTYCHV